MDYPSANLKEQDWVTLCHTQSKHFAESPSEPQVSISGGKAATLHISSRCRWDI